MNIYTFYQDILSLCECGKVLKEELNSSCHYIIMTVVTNVCTSQKII
jgi:hypothetical protein